MSSEGGDQPVWHPLGTRLSYLGPGGVLTEVSVTPDGPVPHTARQLFSVVSDGTLQLPSTFTYDIAPNGKRFLVNAGIPQATPAPVNVALNWASRMRR